MDCASLTADLALRDEHEAAAFVSAVLTSAPLVVMRWDTGLRRLLYVNRPEGTTARAALGRPVEAWVDAETAAYMRREAAAALATGRPRSVEVSYDDDQRGFAHYRTFITPHATRDGVELCLVSIDVSEELSREQALRERDEALRLSVEAAGLAFWRWDAATGEATWDDRMRAIFGRDAPVSWPRYSQEVVHPDDRAQVEAAIAAGRAANRFLEPGHRVRLPDGEVRWIMSAGRILRGDDGRAVELLGCCVDITDKMRAQERTELAVVEALDKAQRELGHDLHDDLGQQLTGISLLLGGLARKLEAIAPNEAATARKVIALVGDAQRRARRTARSHAAAAVDSAGLRAALTELSRFAETILGTPCACDCGDPLPTVDASVANHIYRVAQEAVSNAVRHGRATKISLQLVGDDAQLTLTISDDGRGFDVPTAFSASRMGLLVMQRRANLLGGSLTVESRPGAGATVHCVVPLRR